MRLDVDGRNVGRTSGRAERNGPSIRRVCGKSVGFVLAAGIADGGIKREISLGIAFLAVVIRGQGRSRRRITGYVERKGEGLGASLQSNLVAAGADACVSVLSAASVWLLSEVCAFVSAAAGRALQKRVPVNAAQAAAETASDFTRNIPVENFLCSISCHPPHSSGFINFSGLESSHSSSLSSLLSRSLL